MRLKKHLVIKYLILYLMLLSGTAFAQNIKKYKDSLVVSTGKTSVSVNYKTGRLNYHFDSGVVLNNTIAYINEITDGYVPTSACRIHQATTVILQTVSEKALEL